MLINADEQFGGQIESEFNVESEVVTHQVCHMSRDSYFVVNHFLMSDQKQDLVELLHVVVDRDHKEGSVVLGHIVRYEHF